MCIGKKKAAPAQQSVDNSQAVADNQAQVDRQIEEQRRNSLLLIEASDRQAALGRDESARQANEQMGIQQQAMQMQASALAAQNAAAKAAADAIFNTSQKGKNPNVAAIMRKNAQANSSGVTSTMLTGAQGIIPATLELSRNTLGGTNKKLGG